jgi:protein involved in polysaccharide export with SLBB domain
MSRHQVPRLAVFAGLLPVALLGGSVSAIPQEGAKPAPQPPTAAEKKGAVESEIVKQLEAYDLTPHPLPTIPDDPPPHEGAMIGYTHIIEPPDLVLIEVLEALPGRPISGERLVRSDGTISLGFYGDVHVAGLTCQQAKVKIIKHLRSYVCDGLLGLVEPVPDEEEAKPPAANEVRNPFQNDGERKPEEHSKPLTKPLSARVQAIRPLKQDRSASQRPRGEPRIRPLAMQKEQEEKKPQKPASTVKIPLGANGQITITVEGEQNLRQEAADESATRSIPPDRSDRVFVDVTAYNSKNYYVQGDVQIPGRLPCTGNETVLDALQFTGGLLPTAEPKDIRLVRPARGGKPAKVYKVDLQAIQERGDPTTNYQIFPGDRLVIGRNEVVKKTIELDRLAAPLQTIVGSILQEATTLKSLKTTSPEDYDANLKGLVDFWIQEMKRPEGVQLDENILREALIQRLRVKPEKATSKE